MSYPVICTVALLASALTFFSGFGLGTFLSRAGLTKEAFVATGVVIACLIDFSRLAIYSTSLARESAHFIQRLVAVMLFAVALGLISGLL